jgi:hypothetical protein
LSPPGKRRAERLGVAALGEGWMLDGMHPAARTEAAAASVLVAAGEAAGGEVGGDVGRGWSRGRGGHRVVGSGVRELAPLTFRRQVRKNNEAKSGN